MHYTYQTEQTCSQQIDFDIVDGRLHNVVFYGGCHGNLQGVARLVEGMEIDRVLEKLECIRCGWKDTSCPDQLCRAIRQAKSE